MTVTVTPTVDTSNVPPRIKLDVLDSTGANSSVTVTRNDASGSSSVVRTADGGPLLLTTAGSTKVGTVYDYEAPYGQPATYSVTGAASPSAPVTLAISGVWLIHPGVPDRSIPITVSKLGERARRVSRGVFYPMGRRSPVVVTDGSRKSVEGQLTVLTRTDDEREDLDEILDDGATLLLNVAPGLNWGVDTCYVSIGDTTESRVTGLGSEPMRMWDLPYVVVDRPIGGTQSQYAWSDVIATYSTWSALQAANSTWAAVQAPTS